MKQRPMDKPSQRELRDWPPDLVIEALLKPAWWHTRKVLAAACWLWPKSSRSCAISKDAGGRCELRLMRTPQAEAGLGTGGP